MPAICCSKAFTIPKSKLSMSFQIKPAMAGFTAIGRISSMVARCSKRGLRFNTTATLSPSASLTVTETPVTNRLSHKEGQNWTSRPDASRA